MALLPEQVKLESLQKSIKRAKIQQMIGIVLLVIGLILSAWLLQLAPTLERTTPVSEEVLDNARAFLYSIFCAWFGLVLFAYSYYERGKLLKKIETASQNAT